MSGRIELREAVRRLREAADAAGHLGAGAGTEADRQVLRRVVRDVVREELAGLERPDGTVSRLSGLERRLERLEARRPSGTAMFPPTAPGPEHRSGGARQVRHPVRAAKVAVSALVVLLLLGLAWLLVEPVAVWMGVGDSGRVREAAAGRIADAWARLGRLAGRPE